MLDHGTDATPQTVVVKLALGDEVLAESEWSSRDERSAQPLSDSEAHGEAKWYWHIYDPITIVPLMCATDGAKHLGILLTRGIYDAKSQGIMYRIHSPSLVSLDSSMLEALSPLRTTYAYTTAKYERSVELAAKAQMTQVWMEGVVSSGYDYRLEPSLDWGVLERSYRLFRIHESQNSREQLVIFTPREPDSPRRSFLLLVDMKTPLIGIFRHRPFIQLDDGLIEVDMTATSHAEIAMPDGYSVMLKLRIRAGLQYLSLDVEETRPGASAAPWAARAIDFKQWRTWRPGLKARLQRILGENTSVGSLLLAARQAPARKEHAAVAFEAPAHEPSHSRLPTYAS